VRFSYHVNRTGGVLLADVLGSLSALLARCNDSTLRDLDKALAAGRRAVELDPENAACWQSLGGVLLLAGRWADAAEAARRAAALHAAGDTPEDATPLLILAAAAEKTGDRPAAAAQYLAALRPLSKGSDEPPFDWVGLEVSKLLGITRKPFHRRLPSTGKPIEGVEVRVGSGEAGSGLSRLVDGSGLADGDRDGLLEHDVDPAQMWLSSEGGPPAWIEFDLGRARPLGAIQVWNYNQEGKTNLGIASLDVSVWTATNGWQRLLDDAALLPARDRFDYDEPDILSAHAARARKVRFDDLRAFQPGGVMGLSAVRFTEARGAEPTAPRPPDKGVFGVGLPVSLGWVAGDGVLAHRVYLGADADHLERVAEVPSGEGCEVRLTVCAVEPRYAWKVEALTTDGRTVPGPLWTFSTGRVLAHWAFDARDSEDAADASGFGRTGRFVGHAHVTEDPERGWVLELDGDGDRVECGGEAELALVDGFTISAWVKVNEFERPWQAVVAKGISAWRLARQEAQDRLCVHCAGLKPADSCGGLAAGGTVPANDGQWHHLAAVYDGSRLALHVDGQLDGEQEVVGGVLQTNAFAVWIGDNPGTPSSAFNGWIDDVQIHNTALSAEQIRALHAAQGPSRNPSSVGPRVPAEPTAGPEVDVTQTEPDEEPPMK